MDGDIEGNGVWAAGDRVKQETICEGGKGNAERAADGCEQQTFCKKLANQTRAACAEGLTDGELAAAGRGTGEKKIGDVGAGDQKNDAGEGHEHLQRLRVLAAKRREALGDGCEQDMSFLQIGEVFLGGMVIAVG